MFVHATAAIAHHWNHCLPVNIKILGSVFLPDNEYNNLMNHMKSEPLKDYKFIKATIKITFRGGDSNWDNNTIWDYSISVEDIVPTKK